MFTFEALYSLLLIAGPDLQWEAWRTTWNVAKPSGGARYGGRAKVGMRVFLWNAQGGLCPTCGLGLASPESGDLSHVVGRGPGNRGWIASNIYLAHPACNAGQARIAWEEGTAGRETRANVLARLADMTGWEHLRKDVNEAGYSLILTPHDFAMPEVIATTWPVSNCGQFARFDPAYTGPK